MGTPVVEVEIVETFRCSWCRAIYETREKAEACASRGDIEPVASVGDIVLGAAGFGWFNGDVRWISNPDIKPTGAGRGGPCPNGSGNCFSDCCTYAFYYVVTAIEREGEANPCGWFSHRLRYHLMTKAMDGSYREGWTDGGEAHIAPKPVENPPPFVVADSKDLIGKKASHLL